MMFVLLLLSIVSMCGAVVYNKRINEYKKSGCFVNAVVLNKDIMHYKPAYRGGKVTRYIFNIEYKDNNGFILEGVFSTTNRYAKRIKEHDNIRIFITGNEIILKEDMPTKAGLYFLSLSGAILFMLFVLGIVCEYI